MAKWSAIIALVATLLFSAVAAYTDFAVTGNISEWNQADWSLSTTRFEAGQFQSRMSLANGYVGASLAAAGPFFEADVNLTDANGPPPVGGWPLDNPRKSFSTISGFFNVQQNASRTNYGWLQQYGWDSFIAGIPHPTGLHFSFEGTTLDATVSNTTISNFFSKHSFKTGVGEWAYTWTPEGCDANFNVSYMALFSRARPNVIAVKAIIISSEDINGTVTDLLDGRSADRSYLNSKGLDENSNTIYTSVHPDNLPEVTGWIVSGANFSNGYTDLSSRTSAQGCNASDSDPTIGQTYKINLGAGKPATFYKFVGIASTDKFDQPEKIARKSQDLARQDSWDVLVKETSAAWEDAIPSELVDDFTDPVTGEIPDDTNVKILQIASVANVYYLVQNLMQEGSGLNDESISVGGLVSDAYGGLRFWDADYWMAPGLNIALPKFSKQISNFRVKQYDQALENAAFNNFPNGSALYSWTSGRYGNCTGTGPCIDYQYHLNPDIAFNMVQEFNVTKNETSFAPSRRVIDGIAIAMSNLLKFNETAQKWDIRNSTDPDEYANNVNNTAFTLASISTVLKIANDLRTEHGEPLNETWLEQANNVNIEVSESGITLEYSTMNNSAAVKQADIVLMTYPLDYEQNYTTEQKNLDLDFYANRQSPDGPAMTYSIFAANANGLSPSGCSSFTYALAGTIPYLRAPFYQFSEQVDDDPTTNGDTKPAFPFLTGHGGANQIVPFGFLGLRTNEPLLRINPSLPPQIPYVRIRNFYYAGSTLSATMNSTHTNLTRLATPVSAGVNEVFINQQLPFLVGSLDNPTGYNITVNQTVTVQNRLYWQIKSIAGNIVQCLPATSEDAHVPGQFPIAAIDGASSTRWQPTTNSTASMLVDTSSQAPKLLTSIQLEWGARPAVLAVVYLGNYTNGVADMTREVKIEINGIEPNRPYNAAEAAVNIFDIEPVQSNVTVFHIPDERWSGDYARLEIDGCWEKDGKGATVGEFVLV
ncbi:uncharacterized protein L3040_005693 [Drepanopeziza brunnea f. sp. 'multigermtubi']|uniref:alpha,alpha-trehalase n=1 Tax=Marssonina brunnea f. sp. multigermtubi (strain MB_m1) TaxID=1072389 RepID=K1WYJ9_MARBU|nr:glycosyl hydrolase family 65 protein [Drepanopeziza brunnea f. sp. 'multigermtubi' MB_m1]EKD13683.1 glycosyl hydrolase family 65 protein [Drepanopeziza brunnea f. sp. 'multigermtubi' MB_m1]KAJ5041140.1 hypothetical protein L3040_005693 [Drepanopeziza brunnea f. sp. 'multigermtubi']